MLVPWLTNSRDHGTLFFLLWLVVKLTSFYIVAAVDAGFCLHRALCPGVFPGTIPHVVIDGARYAIWPIFRKYTRHYIFCVCQKLTVVACPH